jgi:hypothetical protein
MSGNLKERALKLVNTLEANTAVINGHNGNSYLKSGRAKEILPPDPLLAKPLIGLMLLD